MKRHCRDCKRDTIWRRGIALFNQFVMHGDFIGDRSMTLEEAREHGVDTRGHTMSATGPAYLAPVDKCSGCGKSLSL